MRILQVHTRYRYPGGEDSVVAEEAAALRAAGHEVHLAEAHNSPRAVRAAAQLAVSAWNPLAKRNLARVIKRLQPDVIHIHNTWFAMSPAVAIEASASGAPVLMTLHNYRLTCSNAQLFRDGHACEDCVGSHPWHGVRHRCYRDSLGGSSAAAVNIALHRRLRTWERAVDRFLVLSQFARSRFIAAGLPPEKLTVKPNFVEDGPTREEPPGRSRRLLFVGRFSEEKGIISLLHAWKHARVDGLELAFIGSGPLEEAVRTAKTAGVTVVGPRDRAKVRRELARARALLLPSTWYEGQPMVLLEALAAGLPVLVSDTGGLPEIARNLGDGFTVLPGDVQAWSRALQTLRDPERVDQAGRLARVLYEERFTPSIGLANLERAYCGHWHP